ncbi:MAG: hypothetical protein ACP5HX_11205, partial [Thermoproteota archaeon]
EEVLTKHIQLKICKEIVHPSYYPLALANAIDSVRPREEHELAKYAIKLYVAKEMLGSPSQEEIINSLRQEVRGISEKINIEGRMESLEQKINNIIQYLEYIKAKLNAMMKVDSLKQELNLQREKGLEPAKA